MMRYVRPSVPTVLRLKISLLGTHAGRNGHHQARAASPKLSAVRIGVREQSSSASDHDHDGRDAAEAGGSAALKAFRDIVVSRTAAHSFGDKDVDGGVLRDIMALTQSAPSSFNVQPWSVVLVRDHADRERLSSAMLGGNARKVGSAPVTAVFCADLEPSKRIRRMVELNRQAGMPEAEISKLSLAVNLFSGEGLVGNVVRQAVTSLASLMQPAPEVSSVEAWSFKNTGLAAQTYILACTAHGLATSPMEGFDARRVRAALDIPDRYGIPIVVSTGYPTPSTATEGGDRGRGTPSGTKRWRYPPEEVVFDGAFGVGMTGIDPVVGPNTGTKDSS